MSFRFRAIKSVCDSGRELRPRGRISTFSNFFVSESYDEVRALGHYLVAKRLNIELMFRNIRELYFQPEAVSRHFTLAEIADMWRISREKAR